ncbi:MAG: diaminopimelate epimerase [Acidimicrobiia bacterium]
MKLEFTKMHGWGNDFVVAVAPVELSADQIRKLCDRRFGVGADGLLVVTGGSAVRMDYWNADGNRAEMCGNGFRCVARFAHDRGMVNGEEFEVLTPVGTRRVALHGDEIDVELGPVKVTGHTEIDGNRYHLIDVGNPHAVVEVTDVTTAEVSVIGPRVETDERFENGTNVEFVRFEDGGVTMRVWERGVGETLACGSGMVAAAFVATKAAKMESPIRVRVPGGEGTVNFRDGSGWLRGPVEYAFEGVWTG